MLAALNHVLFHFGNDAVTSAEILGFITGIANVYYIVRAKVINFPIGLANSAFFLVLFLNVRFYADGYLQVLYILLGFQGWWAWLKAGPNRTALSIKHARLWEVGGAACAAAVVTFILWPLLANAHDLAPWWDALTTGLSVGAILLMNFKRLENWYFWIAADLIYIPLYFYKNLYLTGIVYIGFISLCFAGLYGWRKALHESRDREVLPAALGTSLVD